MEVMSMRICHVVSVIGGVAGCDDSSVLKDG